MSMNDTNTALIKVLGLDAIERITSVDIALRPYELPRITVEQFCGEIQPTATHFRLIAEPDQPEPTKSPLNLDTQCFEARQRLHKFIERSALFALLQIELQSIHYTRRRALSC